MEGGVREQLLEAAGVGRLHIQLAGPQLETSFTTVAHKVGCTINEKRKQPPSFKFPTGFGLQIYD